NLTRQSKTLLMEWCVNCHRNPEEQLRPKSEVYSMTWSPASGGKWKREDLPNWGQVRDGDKLVDSRWVGELVGKDRPTNQRDLGKQLKEVYGVRDGVTMTNCSMCHR